MPLSLSVLASQLADNCVVELVVAMSAPVPSRTAGGGLGGVDVRAAYHRLTAGIRGGAGQSVGPVAIDGLDPEVVGLPDGQTQAGPRDAADGRIVDNAGIADDVRAAQRGADGILVAADAAFIVGAIVPVGRELGGGGGGGDIGRRCRRARPGAGWAASCRWGSRISGRWSSSPGR